MVYIVLGSISLLFILVLIFADKFSPPSGVEEKWEAEFIPLDQNIISSLTKNYQIHDIYKVSPYTFIEKGNVTLRIINGDKEVEKLKIEVK
ncbi:hypothetical protein [Salirhabdus sp. Marseille-P4669]|uniref:hypothetical protein n=1 Tax=Salirhabdus sp. Marseille-P4669 TaxID=2042310 RepID=UPI000C79A697|nr:hypothetical protein [Salirhabdus sp. Marseille-P4669]